jgi:Electron transfer DM13
MNKWKIVIPALAIVLFVAWYAFRPERLFINQRVHEAMPVAYGTSKMEAIESGMFYGVAHPTEGTATIYRMGDGALLLRFTNFTTSNGPNVHVYLVAADEPKDSETVQRSTFIDLGSLKGNIGDQNYALGSDVDLSKYRAVSIWCQRFSVNFGAASLTPDHLASQNEASSTPW